MTGPMTEPRQRLAWVAYAASGLILLVACVAVTNMRPDLPLWGLGAAALLYLLSHGLRAARLAILATPILGISGRSAGLLHFVTAPAALLLPLKLGELLRFQQLNSLGAHGHWLLPVIVLILDRVLDAVFIVLLYWIFASGAGVALPNAVILSIGLLVFAVVTFGVAPSALTALQRYILVNHQAALPRRWLALIDRVRGATQVGARQIRQLSGLALLISAAIWLAELAAMAVLLLALQSGLATPAPEHRDAAAFLLARTASEWSVLMGLTHDPEVRIAAVLGLVSLLVVWPVALQLYLRRIRFEPMRRASLDPSLQRRSHYGI